MNDLIRCKVAKILSERELVITAGSSEGVEVGMTFNIVGRISIEDPDSSEFLESIPVTKLAVRVSTVGNRVSVARTIGRSKGAFNLAASATLLTPYTPPPTLTVGEDDWDTTVFVGDEAIQTGKGTLNE